MTILIGCSGWSYDDWVGKFYPLELAGKKGEWFSYYARFFCTVEINSTFYRLPGELQVQSWIRKCKDLPGFQYSVKVPQLVTHRALVEADLERAIFWAASFEKTCVRPLAKSGHLGGVLLQLSPYFKNYRCIYLLKGVLDSLSYQDYDYAVEFRHKSWLDEDGKEIDPEALEVLRERNVAPVLIDGPGLYLSREMNAADHVYIRFHGRNYDIWYKGGQEEDHRLDRYDYLYSKEHLAPWIPCISQAELKESKVRAYFNNHARSKSVRNAFLLMDMMGIDHKSKEIRLQDQFTLGEF